MSEVPLDTTSPPAPPDWSALGLSPETLELVRAAGYLKPTPVQALTIPLALAGRDVIGSAQTGTGKTASFVLPMVEKLLGKRGTYGLILSPTREIALQTHAVIEQFGAPRGVRSVCMIGGVDMKVDAAAIQTYPQILVATPGRLCDHLDRGNVWLDFIQILVLDEADRMLDMGFSDQLSRITSDLPKERQTLLFSATIAPDVDRLATRILNNPERVAIGKPNTTTKSVEQRFIFVDELDKMSALRNLLREEKGSVIVFARSKDNASRIWRGLFRAGFFDATYLHSDRPQAHREQALREFKEGKFRILVATDVAGRGIHVDAVAHVVNYEFPMEPEDYVHRIGRTGRANALGLATTFVSHRDRMSVEALEQLLKIKIHVEGLENSRPQRQPSGGRGAPRGGSRGGPRGGSGGGNRGGPSGNRGRR